MRSSFTWWTLPLVLLAFCHGCASSSASGYSEQTLTCDKSFQTMWTTAKTVVFWMDGKVELENQSGGMIMATLPAEGMGSDIRLHVELYRLPGGNPSFPDPVTVTVKAVDPQVSNPDKNLKDFLNMIMEGFLEGVALRSGCIRPIEKLPQ